MALSATMWRFEIDLADSDRGVYEKLDLRVAQHPSESERFMVTRVIARCLEHDERMEFGRGISTEDEPALMLKDLTGVWKTWIDVGAPAVLRLHKAKKTGARVVVFAWKAADELAAEVAAGVHKADEVEIFALDPAFLDAAIATLARKNVWELSVSGGTIYLGVGGQTLEGVVRRVMIPE